MIFVVAILPFPFFINAEEKQTNELIIPPLIDSRQADHNIELKIENTRHEFYPGVTSNTKGFSQSYLGPTIRLYKGDNTRIRFTNNIGEDTTVHGHGLRVSGELDGGPQNIIAPNETWDIVLPIRQEASTNWYHPQLMGKASEHVHAGLAGFYLVEDENSQRLALPKTYGIDDIPLVVQDRSFKNGKMNDYSITKDGLAGGKREDTLVVNGTVNPFVEVPQGWVRLRLLNGSNARFYNFYLKGKVPFYKIATEGGFLEKPVQMTSLKMAPGERNEIMIDFSDGKTLELMAVFLPAENDGFLSFFGNLFLPKKRVIEMRVDTTRQGEGMLPERLNTITPWKRTEASLTRTFELHMKGDVVKVKDDGIDEADEIPFIPGTTMGTMFGINGKSMDMGRIDERVEQGAVEIWRISGEGTEHPFHIHGASFLILSQNGQDPKPEDRGWKDVVVIGAEWTEVMVKFDYIATEKIESRTKWGFLEVPFSQCSCG